MNTILQQRIEEAVKKTACPQCVFNDGGTCNNDDDCKLFDDFIGLMTFTLQNQWISVDEALPEKRQDVLVAVLDTKSNTYFLGFDNIDDDNGEFLRDKNGFAIENDSHKITHWMLIPSLKGGEI